MKRFKLNRKTDVAGVSGTGIVAEGVQFSNGKVAVTFISGPVSSVIVYNSTEDAEKVHCHGGLTVIEWVD